MRVLLSFLRLVCLGWLCFRVGGAMSAGAAELSKEVADETGSAVGARAPYEWRGLHLDVSRHFFAPEVLRRLMDRMAELHLNRLHLHLTDGPGWRLEIAAYPRLTSVSAWRKDDRDHDWDWSRTRLGCNEKPLYGGFYTQQEFAELVAYARQRGITLVPEIDMPGHAYATLFAYPELAKPGFEPYGNGLHGQDCLDLSNPETMRFAMAVLDELMALLPEGTPIHLGGDEVSEACATREEQRRWLQELVDYVTRRGHPAITWDEAALNGVRGQIVMAWRDDALPQVLATGLPVIVCPMRSMYLNYPQTEQRHRCDAKGDAPVLTEKQVFSVAIPEAPNVIGLQACLWTEHITTPEELWYMAFPRAAAMAARAWGASPEDWAVYLRSPLRLPLPPEPKDI